MLPHTLLHPPGHQHEAPDQHLGAVIKTVEKITQDLIVGGGDTLPAKLVVSFGKSIEIVSGQSVLHGGAEQFDQTIPGLGRCLFRRQTHRLRFQNLADLEQLLDLVCFQPGNNSTPVGNSLDQAAFLKDTKRFADAGPGDTKLVG